jgi:anaerobic ribonucleoside-triphosphate reductase
MENKCEYKTAKKADIVCPQCGYRMKEFKSVKCPRCNSYLLKKCSECSKCSLFK